MLKKSLTAAAIAGFLVLGGASAASAANYPPVVPGTSSASVVVPGQPATVGFSFPGYEDGTTVTFVITGADVSGVTLATIVRTAVTSKSIDKTISGGSASVVFQSSKGGAFTVTPYIDGRVVGTPVTLTVDASAGTGGPDASGPSAGLPATGSELPAAALWLGVGAVGIGGIAIAAGVARLRAHTSN